MKTRRHHNNKGARQIKRGKTVEQVATMARDLGLPIRSPPISGPAVYALERRKERDDIRVFDSCGCVYCDLGLPPDMHATPCTRAAKEARTE